MNEHLHLGAARIDITPPLPIPLAGFAHRRGPFERIHSPLFLRALLFSQDGPAGAEPRSALLISADLFCWGSDLAAAVRESLCEALRMPPEALILHGTHNHSGPQTSRLFTPSLGAADPAYLELVRSAAVRAAELARRTSQPVTVERGVGRCGFGMNRRKRDGGQICMAPNPDGPTDSELTVVRFRALDGATKALLVHFTCHPTVSGANELCAEYPGLAMAELERDAPVVAAFLQGCCGDIRPALIRDGEFYRGDPAAAASVAGELVRETGRVLAGEMATCVPGTLAVQRLKTPLPLAPPPGAEELRGIAGTPGILGEWSELLLSDPARLAWPAVLESTRLDLARGLGLMSFNAEMMVEYGLYTRHVSNGAILPVAYSDGMLGYIPTRRQVEEGGYESAEAFRYYGWPAPFSTAVEDAVSAHIRQLALLSPDLLHR